MAMYLVVSLTGKYRYKYACHIYALSIKLDWHLSVSVDTRLVIPSAGKQANKQFVLPELCFLNIR